MKRWLLRLSYRLGLWFGPVEIGGDQHSDPTGVTEDQYLCQNGEHDWGEIESGKSQKAWPSEVEVTISTGQTIRLFHLITKGIQKCSRSSCGETRQVYRDSFLSPLKKEELENLKPSDMRRVKNSYTPWRKLLLEKEVEIDP